MEPLISKSTEEDLNIKLTQPKVSNTKKKESTLQQKKHNPAEHQTSKLLNDENNNVLLKSTHENKKLDFSKRHQASTDLRNETPKQHAPNTKIPFNNIVDIINEEGPKLLVKKKQHKRLEH